MNNFLKFFAFLSTWYQLVSTSISNSNKTMNKLIVNMKRRIIDAFFVRYLFVLYEERWVWVDFRVI